MNSLTQINNTLCNVEKRLRRLEVLDKKVKRPEEKMKKLKQSLDIISDQYEDKNQKKYIYKKQKIK